METKKYFQPHTIRANEMTLPDGETAKMPLSKRAVVLGLLVSGAAGCGGPAAAVPAEMSLGNPRAPVTVIEYASVACPVCGRWYREVFPAFKAKYIDTGRIKYVAREMLVGDATEESIAAAGFLLARCAGKDKYFSVTDAIYNNQIEIYGNPRVGLLNIAKSMGMDENTFDACIKNEVALRELDARVQSYSKDDKVTATPTFVVNGVALSPGYHPLSDLDAAISAAQHSK